MPPTFPEVAPRPTVIQRAPITLLVAVVLGLAFAGFGATLVLLPDHLSSLGYADDERKLLVGISAALFPLTALAGRLASGRIIDELGVRRAMAIGLAVVVAGSLLLATPGLTGLFAGRLIQGAGDGVLYTACAAAAVATTAQERQGRALNWLSTGIWVGLAGGAAVAPLLPSLRFCGLVAAAVGALGAAIIPLLPKGHGRTGRSHDGKRSFVERAALRPAAVIGLTNMAYAAITGFAVVLAEGRYGSGGLIVTSFGVGLLLARGAFGAVADRVSPRRGLLIGHILLAAGTLGIAASPWLWLAMSCAVVAAFGHALPFPILTPLAVAAAGEARRGAALATVTAGFDIVIAVAYFGFGVLAGVANPTAVFVVAALGVAAANVVSRGIVARPA
jgi:MFS family permease